MGIGLFAFRRPGKSGCCALTRLRFASPGGQCYSADRPGPQTPKIAHSLPTGPPSFLEGSPRVETASQESCLRHQTGTCQAKSSTAGGSAVEFALVAPMFFLLFFAVFDFARLFYAEMTLQNAVRQAGRYAVTGNYLPDPQHQGQNLSRVNSIIKVAQQAAGGLSVSHIQISSLGGGNGSAGGPGDTVTISLTSTLQLMTPIVAGFFPNGAYTFTVSVSFKNEPFPPGNTG